METFNPMFLPCYYNKMILLFRAKWCYISKCLWHYSNIASAVNFLSLKWILFFYSYVVKWLDIQFERILEESGSEAEADEKIIILINEVMSNIRFPMMDSRQLAGLLLSPLVMKYKDFFIEKMAVGVAFHKGERNEKIDELQCSENGKLLFTPRLYTAEQWSSSIVINNFSGLPSYHPRTLVCTSPPTLRENLFEQTCEWVIFSFHIYVEMGTVYFKSSYLLFLGWKWKIYSSHSKELSSNSTFDALYVST